MEIVPTPRPQSWSPPRWLLLCLLVLTPAALLVALPTALGLERYVIAGDGMNGALDRGSVALERVVPSSDLEVGDVVTYDSSADGPGELVTERVVRTGPGYLVTRADAAFVEESMVATAEQPTMARVVVAVPYVGYPFLVAPTGGTWMFLLIFAGAGLGLGVAGEACHSRRRGVEPAPAFRAEVPS